MAVVYMGSHGSMSEFDRNKESWKSYIERLAFYFEANDVVENNKTRAILLTICGLEVYKLISNLLVPKSPREETYDNIVKAIERHLEPTPSVALQRYNFNQTGRRPHESISAYVNYLRQQAKQCNFADILEDMLRDRLVCGVNNESIQRRLFAEPDSTFKKAVDIALAEEAVAKQTNDITSSTAHTVNVIGRKANHRIQLKPCFRCLGTSHNPTDCKFKTAACHFCGKIGHIQPACRNKNRGKVEYQRNNGNNSRASNESDIRSRSSSFNTKKGSRTQHHNHFLSETDQKVDDSKTRFPPEYELYSINECVSNLYRAVIIINGTPTEFQIDTGASVSLMSENNLSRLPLNTHLDPTSLQLQTYTGEKVQMIGKIDVEAQVEDKKKTLPLYIVKGEGPTLLGRNWLSELQLNWQSVYQLRNLETKVFEEFQDVFDDSQGSILSYKGKIAIDSKAATKYFKPRPLPFSMKEKVEHELQRLENEGIISKVTSSEWAAPVVPVLKKNGSLRLCGDYRATVNSAIVKDTHPIPTIEEIFCETGRWYYIF